MIDESVSQRLLFSYLTVAPEGEARDDTGGEVAPVEDALGGVYCTIQDAERISGLSPWTLRRLAQTFQWPTQRSGRAILYRLADIYRAKDGEYSRPPEGFLPVSEVCKRLQAPRGTVYNLARKLGWGRYLSAQRDLFICETDVMIYLATGEHHQPQTFIPPDEIEAESVPAGYSSAGDIARRYQRSRVGVYQAATFHRWRRVRVGRWVYFCDADVRALYGDPLPSSDASATARPGYTLAEVAQYWGISLPQAALAARINDWRRLQRSRFAGEDVEREGAIGGITDFISAREAARQLNMTQGGLEQTWREKGWRIVSPRVSKKPVNFFECDAVTRYAESIVLPMAVNYYSLKEVQDRLEVSWQRVLQLAEAYGWQRIKIGRRTFFLRNDVDAAGC